MLICLELSRHHIDASREYTEKYATGEIVAVPKLTYSSEKLGCGATIELDNKDVIIVSIDRGEVLVRQQEIQKGLLKNVTGSWIGIDLYRSRESIQKR